jgi:hypothetical protein
VSALDIIKFEVKQVDRGYNAILAAVQACRDGDSYVKVGVLEPKPRVVSVGGFIKRVWKRANAKPRKPRGTEWTQRDSSGNAPKFGGERPTNAQIAAYHEFGAPARHIPERSFIRSTFDVNRAKYVDTLRKLVKGIYEQKITVERALGIMGAMFSTDIKKRITTTNEIQPPNAPATLARKLAKTRAGSKGEPRVLVDTGQLVNSITWSVVLQSRNVGQPAGGQIVKIPGVR